MGTLLFESVVALAELLFQNILFYRNVIVLTPSLPCRQSVFVFLFARAYFDFYECVYENVNNSGV
jgi:hypothetical protein